jgi:uncharacterized protein
VITLDTSAIIEILASSQSPVVEALRSARGERLIPAEILAEVTYMTEIRFGARYVRPFLDDLDGLTYSCDVHTDDRLPRIRELLDRYADLDLGFCDAAVIACAETNGGHVLTLDRRDFDVIAGEGRLTILP